MLHLNDVSQDSLNAEVSYRREQLMGITHPARPRVRRAQLRRARARDSA